MRDLVHVFLIRDPGEMLTSLLAVTPEADAPDTGLPQQCALFESLAEATGRTPLVLDARDVLERPGPMLAALCDALDVPFDDAMLAWPAGPRATDGVWAPHWYDAVWKSTGFQPYRPKQARVPPEKQEVLRVCDGYYRRLAEHRMRV